MTDRKPNYWILGAAAVMVACAGIHAFIGGPEINAPLQASALAPDLRAVMAVCWHALTGLFLIFGAALIWSALRRDRAIVLTVLATSLVFAALFIGIGLNALGSITIMPQWVLFAAVILALSLGLARDRDRAA